MMLSQMNNIENIVLGEYLDQRSKQEEGEASVWGATS
jgi:hypothetical protein